MQRLAVVETGLGHAEPAHDRLRQALAVVKGSDNPMVLDHSPTRLYASLAVNRLRAGDLVAAGDYLAEGYAAQQAVVRQGFGECVTCDVLLYPAAVLVHLARGAQGAAEQACARAEEATTWFRSRGWIATARHLRGLLAEARGEPALAAGCFQQAAEAFRGVGQPYDLAQSLEALARVTGDERSRQEARALYATLGAAADARRLDPS
jgi:hypothetical protein